MSVCLSSLRYSGVISERDSISSPDLIVFSNSAAVGMASILGQMKAGKIWCPGRTSSWPKRGGYSSAWLEPQIVDLGVAGSNPASHPSKYADTLCTRLRALALRMNTLHTCPAL